MKSWLFALLSNLGSRLTFTLVVSCALLSNSVNALHFSKQGSAGSSWSVSSGSGNDGDRSSSLNDSWKKVKNFYSSDKRESATGASKFAQTHAGKAKTEVVPLVKGLKEAMDTNSVIEMAYSLGLPLTKVDTDSPKAVSDLVDGLVSLPIKETADAAVLVLSVPTMEDMKTDMLVDQFTGVFNGKTRGFLFQLKTDAECDKEDKKNELLDHIRIPSDAASFVVEEAGLQTVELSHPVILNTADPIILVLETVSENVKSTARGMYPAKVDCPIMVVDDMSTKGLVPRSLTGLEGAVDGVNPIIGEILTGVYDIESGSYVLLRDRFSTPHVIGMQILGIVGEIGGESDLVKGLLHTGRKRFCTIISWVHAPDLFRPAVNKAKETNKPPTLKFPSRNNAPSNLMHW